MLKGALLLAPWARPLPLLMRNHSGESYAKSAAELQQNKTLNAEEMRQQRKEKRKSRKELEKQRQNQEALEEET